MQVSGEELAEMPLEKGICNFPSDEERAAIATHLKDPQVVPGGSAANTARILGMLRIETGFISCVGNDEHGELFTRDMRELGATPLVTRSDKATGTAMTFVTPDAQRTFAVHLGASLEYREEDLPLKEIKNAEFLYVSSYLLEDPNLRAAAIAAMRAAKKVALDLSDPSLVTRNKELLREVVAEHVDIVFANEGEAEAFTGKSPEDALLDLAELCDIAIVKLGAEGSLLKQGGTITKVAAHVVEAVDTTGAGDAYAAGVLYGLLKGEPLARCGQRGAILAAEVIQHMGARLPKVPESFWGA
jgi:sugar/nucleoside kinase (ribokinase family)